jgi:hypothetical protein
MLGSGMNGCGAGMTELYPDMRFEVRMDATRLLVGVSACQVFTYIVAQPTTGASDCSALSICAA